MKITLVIIIGLLFGTISVSGMSDYCRRTTKGTDFWFGFMDNAIIPLDFKGCFPNKIVPLHYGEIIVTSDVGADFRITVGPTYTPLGGLYHVDPGKEIRVKFDMDLIPRNSINLTSSDSVSVYALNFSEYTSDMTLIYPTSSLGKEYFAMCGKPDLVDFIKYPFYYNGWVYGEWVLKSTSEFLIVATQNGTNVDITPRAKVNNSDAPFRITLNRGQQYLVTSLDTIDGAGDLTGSYIKSNKPIALFSGCIWTQIPSGSTGSPGHLYEQIPSLQTWGKKFVAVPFKLKRKDIWRVLASKNGTTVRVTGKAPFTLNRGEWQEFPLAQTEPSFIESDKPVLVAQYTTGGTESCDTCATKTSMVIVSPVNQASEKTAFVTCEYQPYTDSQWGYCTSSYGRIDFGYEKEKLDISSCQYFINVIARDNAAGKINLDNSPVSFTSLPGSGYGYAQVSITAGPHLLESTEPGKGFVAYAYNYWGDETRSYGLAQTQDLFVDLASYNNTGPEIPDVWCYGDTLRAGDDFDTYQWTFGGSTIRTASYVIPQNGGWYKATVTTNDGCNLTDSIELKVDKPVVDLGKDLLLCIPDSTVLSAGNQSAGIPFIHWLWSTPAQDTTQKITISKAGIYGVRIIDKYGCKGGDDVKVSTDPRPVFNFSTLDTLVCGSKTDTLSVKADKGTFTVKRLSDGFTFNSLNVGVPAFGTYPFMVRATDNLQCYSESEVKIGFHEKPKVYLGRDSTYCRPDTVVLDSGDNFSKYLWLSGEAGRKISVTKPGTYGVNVTNNYGCNENDKVVISFTDRPKFDFGGLDTLVCGSKSALLNIKADEGSFSVERLSDHFIFNSLNVNVPLFDSYKFRIIATDQFKCSSNAVINVGFHKIPAVGINIDSTKCSGYSLNAGYLGDANVIRSDFTWAFGGDVIASGIGKTTTSIPLGIGNVSRDLKLTVQDMGCLNSKTISNIKVTPLMQVSVDDSAGCVPFTAQFRTSSTEPVTYDWNFGDGSRLSGLTANPSHIFQNVGYYPVILKVKTNSGCINEAKMDSLIYVAEIPDVGFSLRPEECLIPGNHQIFYKGSSGNSDTYQWDLSSFNPTEIIQNPGTSQGPFTFNMVNKLKARIGLQVVSRYGCKSSIGEITVKRSPLFSFSVSNEKGCIPLETAFDAMPGDNLDRLNYLWNFGDGITGKGMTTTHSYKISNLGYGVSLTAISSVTGCSDTINKPGLVSAYPIPEASFYVYNKATANGSAEIEFVNNSVGAVSYLWDFGDGATSKEINPLHTYSKLSRSNILLTAYNDFSCSDTTSHELLVGFERIYPPTAFSPNSLNEVDREFRLTAEGVKEEGYHFTIISRWNDLVFETRNEIRGWQGRMRNGEMAPAGNYVWVLDYFDTFGRPHHQSGTVTLLY